LHYYKSLFEAQQQMESYEFDSTGNVVVVVVLGGVVVCLAGFMRNSNFIADQ